MASGSLFKGRAPDMMPEPRLCPCVLSRAAEPTRMITSAPRLWASEDTIKLPFAPTMVRYSRRRRYNQGNRG